MCFMKKNLPKITCSYQNFFDFPNNMFIEFSKISYQQVYSNHHVYNISQIFPSNMFIQSNMLIQESRVDSAVPT